MVTQTICVMGQEEKNHLLEYKRRKSSELIPRSYSPDPKLMLDKDFERRKGALWNAINAREVRLAQSVLDKEFEWVNKLYLMQATNNGQVSKPFHEQMQAKLQFTQRLFTEIGTAIAKEDARQEYLRKFSAPGQFCTECLVADEPDPCDCIQHYPQWGNLAITGLTALIAIISCATGSPSRASTSQPCDILPGTETFQLYSNCSKTSVFTGKPCASPDQNNVTQVQIMQLCCEKVIDALCMPKVDYYNRHVYPKKVWEAWQPAAIILPALAALQVSFQVGGCLYRRSRRLREPIKRLMLQKCDELELVQKEFKELQLIADEESQL